MGGAKIKPRDSIPGFFTCGAFVFCYHSAMDAWEHWYHITGTTYGAWVPGDPRGFRTRHHREHVEGDYRHPPPVGLYERRFVRAKSLMKRPAVVLSAEARVLASESMAEALMHHGVRVAVLAVGGQHYHILGRFVLDDPRRLVGIAKKHSAHALSKVGLVGEGGVWAVRSRALPITSRGHAASARAYIIRHVAEGCAVWKGW